MIDKIASLLDHPRKSILLMKYPLILLLLGSLQYVYAQSPRRFPLPPQLHEASGLLIQAPDTLWWHNDSGGEPRLLATDREGNLIDSIRLQGAINRDWEDITADDQGHWYIGDFGNNRNNRQDLTIYRFWRESSQLDSIRFSYPEQQAFPPEADRQHYNLEGFFWADHQLHLFTKSSIDNGNGITRHYVLPDSPGVFHATLVDSLILPDRVVTAAAVSPDRKRVALLTYTFKLGWIFPRTRTTLFIFEDFPEGRYLQGTLRAIPIRTCLFPTQYEAVDFLENNTVIVGSEAVVLRAARARRIRL